jgi:hypothetical protein
VLVITSAPKQPQATNEAVSPSRHGAAPGREVESLKEQVRALEVELAKAKARPATVTPDDAKTASRNPSPAPTTSVKRAPIPGPESPILVTLGDGELRVRCQIATLYIPANIPKAEFSEDVLIPYYRTEQCGYSNFMFLTYRDSAGGPYKKPIEGHFRVNGKPEKLSFRSTDEAVVSVTGYDDNAGLSVEALVPGTANIVVSLAGRSVAIPLKVVQIPIRAGDYRIEHATGQPSHTKEEVIKVLGLPDERQEIFVRWPESVFIAGHHYRPRAGAIWLVQLWKYKRYPGAVITFTGNTAAQYVHSDQVFEIAESP